MAALTAVFTSIRLSRSSIPLRLHVTAASQFNITFAPNKTDTEKPDLSTQLGDQLFIPWIVRGEDGKLNLQSGPPEKLLRQLANSETKPTKTKKERDKAEKKEAKFVSKVEPQFSKAARRFYNENFREKPQRICKVLAAAGELPLNSAIGCSSYGSDVAKTESSIYKAGRPRSCYGSWRIRRRSRKRRGRRRLSLRVRSSRSFRKRLGGFTMRTLGISRNRFVRCLLLPEVGCFWMRLSRRICKVLTAAGVASRRSSEELVSKGLVTVNGVVCTAPQTKVDPARDVIYVEGNRLPKKLPPKVYFALNKPKGYICSSGEKETKSVVSLFDDYLKDWDKRNPGQPKPRLFTVGRLDVATTGLIIVTNDGEFAQKLSHPSSNLSKEYIATIDGTVNKRHLITISEGTVIDGTHCTPDVVELLPQQPDIKRNRIRIVVHEGRNHEVRELVKKAGLQIYSLKRVRIGGFRLPSDLLLGKHVELKQSNLSTLGWKSSKVQKPKPE